MKNFKVFNEQDVQEPEVKAGSNEPVKPNVVEPESDTVEPDQEPEQDVEDPEKDSQDSEIGEWVQVGKGWVVKFQVNGNDYVASFSPLDEKEKHWKFTYFKQGQRDSSDIKKFGAQEEWGDIWAVLVDILRDFVRILKPSTLKFIGMSSSKRPTHYRELYKIYVKKFFKAFRKQGYISSFDAKSFDNTPSLVIRKNQIKAAPKEEAIVEFLK